MLGETTTFRRQRRPVMGCAVSPRCVQSAVITDLTFTDLSLGVTSSSKHCLGFFELGPARRRVRVVHRITLARLNDSKIRPMSQLAAPSWFQSQEDLLPSAEGPFKASAMKDA